MLDEVQISMSPASLMVLKVLMATLMFGVALDLRIEQLKGVLTRPRAALVGLTAQYLLLPALVFTTSSLMQLQPSLMLGMILVASCPGGNVSNYLTHTAHGDVPTSLTLTALSTILAPLSMPLQFAFWGSMSNAKLGGQLSLPLTELLLSAGIIIGLPVVAGMGLAHQAPTFAERIKPTWSRLSSILFTLFVVGAVAKNASQLGQVASSALGPIVVTNALAMALGWTSAWVTGLAANQRRSLTFEVGIQNTGLGLVIALSAFEQQGAVAVACALWGVWHLISGGLLALVWSYSPTGPARSA